MNSGGIVLGVALVILMAVAPFIHIFDKEAWGRRWRYLWFSAISSLVVGIYLIVVPLSNGAGLSLDDCLSALALGCLVIPTLVGLELWTTWKLLTIAHNFKERVSWRNDDNSQ